MTKPATPTAKPFKSALAAKFAFRKAEKAFEQAQQTKNQHAYDQRATGWDSLSIAENARLEGLQLAAYETMDAVYRKVIAEGYWVKSWHCGPNTTRDLIAANMD